MANTLATPRWVMDEVARGFVNEVRFINNVNRTYDDQYMQNGTKVGNTVEARLPQRFMVTDGQAYQPQNLLDQTVPITLTNQRNVAFGYSSAQETTELQSIRTRYINPASEALANNADYFAMAAVYRDIYSSVGTPGVTPSANMTFLQAGVKLTDLAGPMSGRVAILDALASATLANTNQTLFRGPDLGKQWRSGQFAGEALGISEWYVDPNRPVHTTGTFTASTPLVNGATQTGSTLATDGWASGASSLKKGDVFTIGGVYSVNPLSYASTGRLQQFVVTADTADASGAMATLPISPSIITSGALQTVTDSPADNAVITVLGATSAAGGTLATTVSPQSLVFHPDAFAFVMADLVKPGAGAKSTTVRSKALGLAIRMVEQYQLGTDQNGTRLDILIGAATVQARLAVRVWG